MTRFGIYESLKNNVLADEQGQMPFYQKVLLGAFAGTCGGVVGTPADMINVRYSLITTIGCCVQCQHFLESQCLISWFTVGFISGKNKYLQF